MIFHVSSMGYKKMLSLWTAEYSIRDHSIKGHPREFFAQKKVIFLVAVSLYLDIYNSIVYLFMVRCFTYVFEYCVCF
jgi:hypothetical protein